MATFTIDLLSGNVYLFDKNFTGSGSTSGGTGGGYSQVDNYVDLPPASTENGNIYVVLNSSGSYVLNRREAGLYYSNGTTWKRLGDIPSFFLDGNFQIVDSADNTKGFFFETSGITTNNFRKITVQNSSGTIAYLTDLNVKLDKSVFNTYTGTTAPATYVLKSLFNTYTGTTAPSQFVGIGHFNAYTGATETRLQAIEAELADEGYTAIQLVDLVGGVEVNNVSPIAVPWTSVEFTGTSLVYTGSSRIYFTATDEYEIAYNLCVRNEDNTSKTIGSLIRLNGTTDITPLSVATSLGGGLMVTGSNNISKYKRTINAGSYIQLFAFRVGNAGSVTTVPLTSWINIIRI